jgi:hypothetical protein
MRRLDRIDSRALASGWLLALSISIGLGITAGCGAPPASPAVAAERRVTMADLFTIAVPKTATVSRYPSDHGAIEFVKDATFEMHINPSAGLKPSPLRPDSAPRTTLQIDRRAAIIDRYEDHGTGWPYPFFVEGYLADVTDEGHADPTQDLAVRILANCKDKATQDAVEGMVRSIRFLPLTSKRVPPAQE